MAPTGQDIDGKPNRVAVFDVDGQQPLLENAPPPTAKPLAASIHFIYRLIGY